MAVPQVQGSLLPASDVGRKRFLLTRYHSQFATCLGCGRIIEPREPCLRLSTMHGWHWTRSIYVHFHCVDGLVEDLRRAKETEATRFFAWNLRG